MIKNKQPIVSVRLMVYNNELFIRDTIEGILKQKTNFLVEIVVGDDFSTDSTLNIIKEYNDTEFIYFNILNRPLNGNYYKKRKRLGRLYNFIDIIENSSGKYVALCDGDDYWTDPLKLQKQVDILEKNKDVNICFHRANILREDVLQLYEIPSPFEKEKFKYLELLRHYNFIATASVVFRKTEPIIFPDWFDKITYGDLGLYKIVSKDKSFLCINEVMCVYRIHDGGVYSGLTKKQKEQNYLSFYKTIYKTLNDAEKKIVRVKIKRSLRNIFNLMIFESKVLQRIYTTYDRIKSKFI